MRKIYSDSCFALDSFPKVLKGLTILFLFNYSAILSGQSSMSKDKNKEIVQKYFDDIVNKHNLSEMKDVFADDYIWHTMDGREIHSSLDSAHIANLKSVFHAIPDIRYTIISILSEGDMVAVNSTVAGSTQSPSGKNALHFKQMFFFRVSGGKIKEEWEVLDSDLMMKQMGWK
jgi:predicted ester cyclase